MATENPYSPESPQTSPLYASFLKECGIPIERNIFTPSTPFCSWTMEMYRPNDIRGGGGLGILEGDKTGIARKIGLDTVVITPFYPISNHQLIENLEQRLIDEKPLTPEDFDFEKIGKVEVKSKDFCPALLSVYQKIEDSVKSLTFYDPNFRSLYWGKGNCDHRLYQMAALGFGGYKILQGLQITPAFNQLNESAATFGALARLDHLAGFYGLDKALEVVRRNTLYTNHTNVPAAESPVTADQFDKIIFPNIENRDVYCWLKGMIEKSGGEFRRCYLALELSGMANGVSLIHSQEASKKYFYFDERKVKFKNVTNGISLDRWWSPERLDLFRKQGILNFFDLPAPGYEEKIEQLDNRVLEEIFQKGRGALVEYLKTRKDQYGQAIDIPLKSLKFAWFKRLAGYKQPDLPFTDPDKLAQILEKNDAYFLMAGKAHSTDEPMQKELARILKLVDVHPILRKRVVFVQDYDEGLSKHLVQGIDFDINVPINYPQYGGDDSCSTEACGTSWMKIFGRLIGTLDGGMADLFVKALREGKLKEYVSPFLEVTGKNKEEQSQSFYEKMEEGIAESGDQEKKWDALKKQWIAFLPTVSGSRMVRDYIKLVTP